jgi:hypothetical protein
MALIAAVAPGLIPAAVYIRPISVAVACSTAVLGIALSYFYSHGDSSSWRFMPKYARNEEAEKREREVRYRNRHKVFVFGVTVSVILGLAEAMVSLHR